MRLIYSNLCEQLLILLFISVDETKWWKHSSPRLWDSGYFIIDVNLAEPACGSCRNWNCSNVCCPLAPMNRPIRVSQEVGRSDQGPCCPFLLCSLLFRCNGQLKTIQTRLSPSFSTFHLYITDRSSETVFSKNFKFKGNRNQEVSI